MHPLGTIRKKGVVGWSRNMFEIRPKQPSFVRTVEGVSWKVGGGAKAEEKVQKKKTGGEKRVDVTEV